MKILILALFAFVSSCNQNSSEFTYKAAGSEQNASLLFDGSKFQLVYNNAKLEVVPEIEQLASDSAFAVAEVASNKSIELSDGDAKPLFNIKIATNDLSCSANQTEIKAELAISCVDKNSSTNTDPVAEEKKPPSGGGVKNEFDQLTTTQPTFFKISTTFSNDLSAEQKCAIAGNITVSGKIIETQVSHYKFIPSQDIPSCPIGKSGSTIYIFTGHVK